MEKLNGDLLKRVCTKCNEYSDNFRLRKRVSESGEASYKLNSHCKNCEAIYNESHKNFNKEHYLNKSRKRYQDNKEEINKKRKQNRDEFRAANPIVKKPKQSKEEMLAKTYEWQKNNPDKRKRYIKKYNDTHKTEAKIYYENNREYKIQYTKDYNSKNKDKRNEKARERRKDPQVRLRHAVSVLVRHHLKGGKDGSITKYLWYPIIDLKNHLESLFEPWMSWDNWGVYNPKEWDENDQLTWKWQIDHIISQAILPYKSMADDNFKKCWSLENLRPYSAKKNILDGIKLKRQLNKLKTI